MKSVPENIYLKTCSTSFPVAQKASLSTLNSSQRLLKVGSCSNTKFSLHRAQLCCAQSLSCGQLCDPMDCRPPGSSVHGNSPGKNTGLGCHALLQGIFPTWGSNPCLPHCRQIFFYCLSHQRQMANALAVVRSLATLGKCEFVVDKPHQPSGWCPTFSSLPELPFT